MRRRGRARVAAVGAVEQRREVLERPPPLGDLQHRPDEHAVHVAHERVGLDLEREHVAVLDPARRQQVAREARVVGLGRRERGEVVLARAAARRTRAAASRSRRARPQQRPPAPRTPSARGSRARGSGTSGSSASWRASKPSAASAHARTATSGGSSAFSASARSAGALVRGDLPRRVNARGPSAPRPSADDLARKDPRQRRLDLRLHRPPARLTSPAIEARPVVLEIQARRSRGDTPPPTPPERRIVDA